MSDALVLLAEGILGGCLLGFLIQVSRWIRY